MKEQEFEKLVMQYASMKREYSCMLSEIEELKEQFEMYVELNAKRASMEARLAEIRKQMGVK